MPANTRVAVAGSSGPASICAAVRLILMPRRAVLAFALLLQACRREAAPQVVSVAGEIGEDAASPLREPIVEKLWDGEVTLPEDLRDTPPFGNDVKRATCGKRGDCSVMREKSAGKTASGESLSVAILRLWEVDGMSNREYWALVRRAGVMVARARIATEYVTASYSAERTLRVGPNTLTTWHDWWPTSNWQSYPRRTFQLWPPRLVAFEDTPHHRGEAAAFGTDKLDFTAGTADGSYACDARSATFAPIPVAKLDPGLDPAKGLGACAARIDGTTGHGFTLAGTADPKDGQFLVAMFDALYVEVHDDHWTEGDALEIHVGRPAGFMQCFDPLVPSIMHVIHTDGRADTPADADALQVERLRDDGDTRLFRIDGLPLTGLTVVQRDADGGGRPVRRIGTSPLHLSPELGDVMYTTATCAKTDGGASLVPYFEN